MNAIPESRDHDVLPVDNFATEGMSAVDFDRRIDVCVRAGVFERSFAEVWGYYLARRPGRQEQRARIDRVLIPGPMLREAGWTKTIGVEIKKSDCDFGAAVSQAIDYTYCNWNVGMYWLYCERIFLWPFAMPHGPVQSVMLQNGVGTVHSKRYRSSEFDRLLVFQLERNNIVVRPDGSIERCTATDGGKKTGSR